MGESNRHHYRTGCVGDQYRGARGETQLKEDRASWENLYQKSQCGHHHH